MKVMNSYWTECEIVPVGEVNFKVQRGALIQQVFEAGYLVEWSLARVVPPEKEKVLRSVVLYSLTRGICGSLEIVEAIESSRAIRYLAANHSFTWADIHHFRRRNMEALRCALEFTFSALGQNLCKARANLTSLFHDDDRTALVGNDERILESHLKAVRLALNECIIFNATFV